VSVAWWWVADGVVDSLGSRSMMPAQASMMSRLSSLLLQEVM